MAQKDLKLLWGSNTKMNGSSKPAVTDGKAYFAIVDGDTKYPDTTAPTNEAFIYFDKDNTRYNVIAKRAIFDALGNKINSTYATDIESSGNTMSLFSKDGGEAIDTATIINSVAIGQGTTRNGTTYHLKVTVNGQASSNYALAGATGSLAGIVTTGNQTFAGIKTFSNTTASSSTTTGAVIIGGGLGVGGAINAGGNINSGAAIAATTTLTAGTSATIGTTLTTGGAASIGEDLTVVGRDIFFGNTTGKIITLKTDADGRQVTLGNAFNIGTYLVKLDGTNATSNGIEFWRGSNSSWKMVNDEGHLRFFNNYTTSAGDYFKVLELEYNTGNAKLKGNFKADTITITNTNAVGHLAFSRTTHPNYITAPAGGYIAFLVDGQAFDIANTELVIANGEIYPGSTNATSLGKSNNNFSVIYGRALTSADALSITSAASKAITFTQGTTQVGQFDTAGSLKITNNIYPTVNNSKTLGTSSLYWNHVYSTNFTGTTFTGTTFTGNAASATKVYVTDTTPTTSTSYRLTYASGTTSSNQDLRYNDDLIYTDTGTASLLRIGCSSHKGQLELRDGSSHYVIFDPQNLTENRVIQISDHAGIMMTSGNYTQWASPKTHTHNVTISHTPAGTISRPTFTGTANQETSANAGYSTVASSGHTHSYTRVSSVSSHSFSTSSYTSGSNSGSAVSFYAYSGSSKPSLTASISGKCLTVTFTSPNTVAYTAAPNSHTHSYNRVSSINDHSVNTSSYTSGTPSGTTNVASNGHKHTYTAAGTISTPTFTGTAYSTTVTTTTQNA